MRLDRLGAYAYRVLTGARKRHYREPNMRYQRLKTVISLARILAREDVRNAAEYLRDHQVPLAYALRILARRGA